MEAAELKNEIKSMEDQHNDTIVELHLFKVKYSNEREQVGNLQSQLTKTEKTLLRERNENERIKEVNQPYNYSICNCLSLIIVTVNTCIFILYIFS